MGEEAWSSALVMLPEGANTAPEPNADQALVKWLRDCPDAASARYCRSSCRISLPDVLSMRLMPEGAMETCRGSTSFAKMRGTCCWMVNSSSLSGCLEQCNPCQACLVHNPEACILTDSTPTSRRQSFATASHKGLIDMIKL